MAIIAHLSIHDCPCLQSSQPCSPPPAAERQGTRRPTRTLSSSPLCVHLLNDFLSRPPFPVQHVVYSLYLSYREETLSTHPVQTIHVHIVHCHRTTACSLPGSYDVPTKRFTTPSSTRYCLYDPYSPPCQCVRCDVVTSPHTMSMFHPSTTRDVDTLMFALRRGE